MLQKTDKRDRAQAFRERLARAMREVDMTQSGLARACGVDRSTVSQLLTTGTRLPGAQLVAECAQALDVSSDWLLGLSEHPESAQTLLANSLEMPFAARALIDEQVFAWHQEAAGYKIRHVPAGLPDMLKTQAMLAWEYAPALGRTTEQAIGAAEDRLTWMRGSRSDYEIALPYAELASFAHGEGYYSTCPIEVRRTQLDHLMALHDQLYPTLRVFLFDARRLYSSPITVFGPLLAALYMGSNYITFRDSVRVAAITKHFDSLIREADHASHGFPNILKRFLGDL
ncbi:MAG: helix-turn-helix transcriptional regulator [Pseudomonadota bacterium]